MLPAKATVTGMAGISRTLVSTDGRYAVVNAGGNGGQIMAVVPKLDMVVMITAGNYNQYPGLERVPAAGRRRRDPRGDVALEFKEPASVGVGRCGELVERHAEHLRELRGGVRDECRFVALAAHRHRREIGAIRFEHEPARRRRRAPPRAARAAFGNVTTPPIPKKRPNSST